MSAVDEYLERSATKSQKIHLEHIRQVVRALVPEAEERISYGLPTFTYQGRPLLHYGAFKNHMSIFPTAAPLAALQSKLRQYTTSKGTIQFTEDNPVSDELLRALVQQRKQAIDTSG